MGGALDWLGVSAAERAYARAWRLARQGEHRQAAAALDDVLRDRPDDWGAHLWRGVFLSETDAYTPALKPLERAESLRPGNPAFHLFHGRVHYDHGQYARALAAFEQGIAARPDDELAHAYRGLALLAAGQAQKAREALCAGPLPSDSGLEGRLLVLVEAALAQHLEARSLETQLTIQEHRGAAEPVTAAVPAWRESLWGLRSALSLRSDAQRKVAGRHLRAGDYLFPRGAYEQAAAEYAAALELMPDSDDARLGLADALLSAGQYERALEQIRRLEEARPGRQDVETGLGLAYLGMGNHRAALEHLQRVAERSTFDFMPAYSCGLCALRLAERLQARRWFERATAMVNPRIAAARLAEMYRVQDAGG